MADLYSESPGENTSSFNYGDDPPPKGDAYLGRWLYNKFCIARKYKQDLNVESRWLRNYEIYRGKHWRQQRKFILIPVNMVFNAIKLTAANLTDAQPRFNVIAHQDGTDEKARQADQASLFWWKNGGCQEKLNMTVRKGEVLGTAIEKMVFNPYLEEGRGDAEIITLDPFSCFPWPGINDIQQMPIFFEVNILHKSQINERWPGMGEQIKDSDNFELLGQEREEVQGGLNAARTTSFLENLGPEYGNAGEQADGKGLKRALVFECWMRDYSTEIIQEPMGMDPMTGAPITQEVEKPIYPGGIRRVIFARGNNGDWVILADDANPSVNTALPMEQISQTYLFDKYPYRQYYGNESDSTNFWGFSVIEQVEPLIMEINKKVSQIVAYIDLCCQPIFILPATAGIQDFKITNRPGQILRPTNHIVASGLRYLQPPPLPADYYRLLDILIQMFDTITGIHDVSKGQSPGSVQAFRAIAALQEKAQTVFRDKIRNLDNLIEWRGKCFISMMQNWYDEPRKIVVSGVGEAADRMTFVGTELLGKYEFTVTSGSTMPVNKEYRRQEALQLFQGGLLDQQAVLDTLDYPNRGQIIARMQAGVIGMAIQKAMALAQVTPGMGEPAMAAIQEMGQLMMVPDEEAKQTIQRAQAAQESQQMQQGQPEGE